MQLKISLAVATLLSTMALNAEDYVTVQYLQYNENNNRTDVSAPSIMINKDFGTDYTLNAGFVVDVVSGASQNYYDKNYDGTSGASSDASSGASAFARALDVKASDVEYGNTNYEDKRVAINLLLTKRLENRDELIVGINQSNESDFYSTELSTQYMHWLDSSKNQSISVGASYQFNKILTYCNDVGADGCSGASEAMDATAFNAEVSFSQNIDTTSDVNIALFFSNDDGYLDNPYLNVIRNYKSDGNADVVGEKRPDSKMAYGFAFKYAKALNDNFTLHLGYRYYRDDWSIDSHTLDGDILYEFGDDWIFKVGLREYIQTEANFFSGYKNHFTDEKYASSDQRLSAFNAMTYKSNIDYQLNDTLNINFGINYYTQSTGLDALYFITGFTYGF